MAGVGSDGEDGEVGLVAEQRGRDHLVAPVGGLVEAGDLQEMLRATWALLTPEQRAGFFRRPEITALLETPEYHAIDTTRTESRS